MSSTSDAKPLTIIQPRKGWIAIDWRELIQYRALFYFLIWRDIKVRYKQTVLGALLALSQPVTYMGQCWLFTVWGRRKSDRQEGGQND